MNFKELLQKITIKHVLFAAMCILLILVIVLFCIVIGKVGAMFKGTDPTEPSDTTASTSTTDDTTVPPTTDTTYPSVSIPPETTIQTEPGHEHEFRLKETVAATCTNYGYNIYVCSCGKQDIPIEEQVAPYGHSYGAGEPVEATCTEYGCTRYVCARCGNVDEKNVVPALGHDFVAVEVVPASCAAEGFTLYQCSHCEMEEMRDITPALEHEYEIVEEHGVTCTQDGYTKSQCIHCGDEVIENVVTAAGHSFGDWQQITDSSWTRTCSSCGAVENSTDMRITNAQASSDYVHDGQGNPYRMYMIYVGTATTPDMVHYTIHDYLDNGTLAYSYDVAQGLIITYTNAAGETATITLPVFLSTVATIPAA